MVKITQSTTGYGAQGTAHAYLTNLDRCNRFFSDAIRFEGVVRVMQGFDAIVTSQPVVLGQPATQAEIEAYFLERGFRLAGVHCFEASETGLICPIDLQIIVTEPSS